jgi:hypothetical protein
MRLDYRSAVMACTLVTLLVALLMLAYALSVKRRKKELGDWAAAYFHLLSGTLLTGLRGFPEGRGAIFLSLRPDGAGGSPARLVLEVRPDGVGASWPYERPALGGMIVDAFEGGSAFRLSFEAPGPADAGH